MTTKQDDQFAETPNPLQAANSQSSLGKKAKAAAKWTRTDVNFWLDCLLGIVFLALVAISVIIRFIFPVANESGGWTLWGYRYDDWSQTQFAVLATLALLILLHVMLHWNWVCCVLQQRVLRSNNRKPDDGWQTIVGVGLLIVIMNVVGIVVGAAALMIVQAN